MRFICEGAPLYSRWRYVPSTDEADANHPGERNVMSPIHTRVADRDRDAEENGQFIEANHPGERNVVSPIDTRVADRDRDAEEIFLIVLGFGSLVTIISLVQMVLSIIGSCQIYKRLTVRGTPRSVAPKEDIYLDVM